MSCTQTNYASPQLWKLESPSRRHRIRKQPHLDAEEVDCVNHGAVMHVVGDVNGWLVLENGRGYTAKVTSDGLGRWHHLHEDIFPTSQHWQLESPRAYRIRSAPSFEADEIESINSETILKMAGEVDGWLILHEARGYTSKQDKDGLGRWRFLEEVKDGQSESLIDIRL